VSYKIISKFVYSSINNLNQAAYPIGLSIALDVPLLNDTRTSSRAQRANGEQARATLASNYPRCWYLQFSGGLHGGFVRSARYILASSTTENERGKEIERKTEWGGVSDSEQNVEKLYSQGLDRPVK
jgi:hypothetical protein